MLCTVGKPNHCSLAGQSRVLDVLHVICHLGICCMKELARSFVWWPGLDDDIETKVQSCTQCQINQESPAPQPLHPIRYYPTILHLKSKNLATTTLC